MSSEFNIKITIDGQEAQVEAGKLRQALEKELGRIEIGGAVDIAGLDAVTKRMAELRKSAGSLGKALAQGMSGQWEKVESTLTDIQSRITGIVRAGSSAGMAGMTEGMGDFATALNEADKKAVNAIQEIKELDARIAGLNTRLGQLGATPVQPLSGAATSTLSELYKGFAEAGYKAYITKLRNSIEKELDTLTVQVGNKTVNLRDELNRRIQENMVLAAKVLEGAPEKEVAALQKHFDALGMQVQVSAQGLYKNLDEVNAAIEAHLAIEPGKFADEHAAWEEELRGLINVQQDVEREIGTMRSVKFGGDTEELIARLETRRRELEGEKAADLKFWQEWAMETPQAVGDALRAEGQSAAAAALQSMLETEEEIKRLRSKQKTEFGKLTQGGTAELPKDAQGTLVDFITAERALGDLADTATVSLKAQAKALQTKVKAFDEARLAAEGFNEAERAAIKQLEKGAQREIRQATPAGTSLEEAATTERAILDRLTLAVQQASQKMEQSLAEPVTEEAEKQATGLLRIWEWISDKLVGHSVIPDMVTAINEWLAQVGQNAGQQNQAQIAAAEQKARALIDLAELEAKAGIEAEKRQTAATITQMRIRQTQEQEAAKQGTLQTRAGTTLEVSEGKSWLREAERQNKLLSQAQTLAAELGLSWAEIATGMAASGDSVETVLGGLKRLKQEQAAANREAQQRARMEQEAQQVTARLGLSWAQVQDAMQRSGAEIGTVVQELKRVDQEQEKIAEQVREVERYWGRALRPVGLFVDELNKARQQSQGLFELTRDLQDIGNSMKMNFGIVTGAVTVAGRDYVSYAKQSDVAARSLALNTEMTRQLRQATIEQSAALAVLNPEETAKSNTIWAQATGQVVKSETELKNILEQTAPIQQAAALSQTDVATLSEATASAINQYGLTVNDTAKVVAIFNKVSNDTVASVGDVAESFKMVGPMADRVNEPINTTAAAFELLGKVGIRGTQAGTSYGRMLEDILVPRSKEAEELLEQMYGSSSPFYDAQGQYIGTAKVLDMLAAATENMTDKEREAMLSTLFETNALRAATPMIRAQIEARKEGYNALEKASEGMTESALSVWQKQLSSWEESDVYRVQQAEMRWKAFWLTVGQQGLDLALPALEKGTRMITDLIAAVQANPWMVKAITAIGVSGVAIGTAITAVGTISKSILSLKMISDTFKSTILKQQTADMRFQSAVVSAAEQFRAIITQAATTAAGTEETGAVAESGIEAQGAVAENAIEAQGAAASFATVTGGITTFLTTLGGLLAGGAIYDALVENDSNFLGIEWGKKANLEQWASVGAYGAGNLAGKITGNEDLGTEWFLKVAEALGEIETEVKPTTDNVARLGEAARKLGIEAQPTPSFLEKLGKAAQDLKPELAKTASEAAKAKDELYQYSGAVGELLQLTPEQTQAAELYIDLVKAQAEAVADFKEQVAEATTNLNNDLAKMESDYYKQRDQEERDFQESQVQAQREYQKRQEQERAAHELQMRRMEEDHADRVADLQISRDAAGLYEEQQSYEKERSRAEEDFAIQQAEAGAEFVLEQATRQQQHVEKMAQMQTQYEEEKQARLMEYTQQVAELQAQHQEDMARIEQEYFDKINEELGYYAISEQQQAAYHAAMLADAQGWLESKRQLWLNYVKNLPTPSSGVKPSATESGSSSGSGGARSSNKYMATGGYAPFGDYTLGEQGREFVLSAQTTRQLEGTMGRLSQERIVQAGGHRVSVSQSNLDFRNVSSADEARIRALLAQNNRQLEERLVKVLHEAVGE